MCEVAPLHTIGEGYERNTLNKQHWYSALSLCGGLATFKTSFKCPQGCCQNWKILCASGGSLPLLLLLEEDDLDDDCDEEEEVDVLLEDDVDETDEDLLLLRFRFLFSFP